MTPLWIIGCPGDLGGADTELWDTMRLWRAHGVPLRLTPTWGITDQWRNRCLDLGVDVREIEGPKALATLTELRGATVVSFCNGEFLKHAAAFRDMHCRVIWVGCMCWAFDAELEHYKTHGAFDRYVFQSEHQKRSLMPVLAKHGVGEDRVRVIHGPMDATLFPYGPRPHAAGTEFVIGRLSRPDVAKFSSNLWPIYRRVPYAKLKARVMGWSDAVHKKLGDAPTWAETLVPRKESAQAFLSSLHAMVPVNGGAQENWPRVGLEAMAAGVPIVAQNQWGWREMIRHGETGFLCDTDEEFAYHVARLAYDEPLRLRMAEAARDALATLVNPDAIVQAWMELAA